MKLIKKSDLIIINGMLVCKWNSEVVFPDDAIIDQANELEELYQKALYLNAQPEAAPAPSLDGFKRASVKDALPIEQFYVETPTIDSKVNEAMKFMSEMDEVSLADKANKMLARYADFIKFVSADYVLASGSGTKEFDMPRLLEDYGNDTVLDITVKDIQEAIAYICGLEKIDDDEEDGRILLSVLTKEEAREFLEELEDHFGSCDGNCDGCDLAKDQPAEDSSSEDETSSED